MSTIRVSYSTTLAADARRIYAIFRDYEHEHPRILPPAHFSNLVVEEGGQGAGTIFRVTVTALGQSNDYRMAVTEPVPGQTIVETDIASGLATTFVVRPAPEPGHCEVEIATEWRPKPGLAGLMERLITPPVMRMIYRRELEQVARYLEQLPERPTVH